MFLQVCLLAAGWHYGRKLWNRWGEEVAREDALAAASASASTVPTADEPANVAAPPTPPADPVALNGPQAATAPPEAETAAVDEQFQTAAVATGLTMAASLVAPSLQVVGGAAVLYGSIPIFQKARQALVEEERIGIEVLDSVGLLASLVARQYTISAIMFLMYAGAQKLRLKTEGLSRQSMLDVFARKTTEVWTLQDGVEQKASFDALRAGDIVVVDAGGSIPADGVVVRGAGFVDQRLLTGESVLVEKTEGEQVFALTIVSSGKLYIRVEKAGQETIAAQISDVLQRTANFASSIELQSKKIADASALPILALSALAFPFVGPRGTVALLNVGIADNMRVIAPLSMLNYLRRAYDAGILIKDGRSLQLLNTVDTIVFDKTGTLTEDELCVRRVHALSNVSESEVLARAAALEGRQTHPIARAILSEAAKRGCSTLPVEDTSYEAGHGLSGRVGEHRVCVGSRRFLASSGVVISESFVQTEASIHEQGRSAVFVACDDVVIGIIEFEPVLRSEVVDVVRALKSRGLRMYLLSGDHEAPTRAMAELLGLDGHFAEVLPMAKAQIIEELQARGKSVCFVGDGINDAIALKKATVSVSLRGASAVAADCAQVMLMEHGLNKLPELFSIAFDFRDNLNGILLTALVPAVIAAGGVFVAGYSTNAVAAWYAVSMGSGLGIAMWPHRNRLRFGAKGAESDPKPQMSNPSGKSTAMVEVS